MKWRQQQPALAQVRRFVEQEDRARPNQGRQHHVALAGVVDARVAPKYLAHSLGVRGEHDRSFERSLKREEVAVKSLTLLEELGRTKQRAHGPSQGGATRARRQREALRRSGGGGARHHAMTLRCRWRRGPPPSCAFNVLSHHRA